MKTDDDELFEQIFAEHCTIGCHEYREEIRNSVLAALKIERERCAKVADGGQVVTCDCKGCDQARYIASAIRGGTE